MNNKHSRRLRVGFLSVLCLVSVGLIGGNAFAAPPIPQSLTIDGFQHMPSSGENHHMKLVGYNDLQGRETLQVTTRGDWAYVGHHNRPSSWPEVHYNPLTKQYEENGTTILDIRNPHMPRIVAHIPNFENRNSRSAVTVYNLMGSGKDYLVRNSEGATAPKFKYEIFDITQRAQGIAHISKVGEITGTPVGSCAGDATYPICGGIVSSTAHKAYFSNSGLLYLSLDEPGFRNGLHLVVYDMSGLPNVAPNAANNFNSTLVGRGWLPGQKLTEPAPEESLSGHHAIVDEENNRVYMGYLSGGNVVSWDISNRTPGGPNKEYPIAWTIDLNPPGKEAHTATVIKYDKVPNFGFASGNPASEVGLPRLYAMVSDEATSNSYWRFTDVPPGVRSGVREKITMLDVTHADETGTAMQVSSWQVPPENYIMRGGRFGPHQFNETVNSEFNKFEDKIAFVAYFNAGVRAIDISDPYKVKEVGYYVPQENPRCGWLGGNQPHPNVQSNDVEVDYRGLVLAPDRVGCGLWILEFEKEKEEERGR
jgi:hypothetical protein